LAGRDEQRLPAGVITLAMQHFTMLAGNLLYTASSGEGGSSSSSDSAARWRVVRTSNARKRWTKLNE
jgi:hypothetical protein